MHFERMLSHIVAGYLIAVGLFFGLASIFQMPYLQIKQTGKFFALGISAVFVALGVGSFFLLCKGKLKKKGATLTEVRKEAIEKMNDPQLLSRIATKDENTELRDLAQDRLKELKGVN